MSYVGKRAISILESTHALLAAEVQGRNRYRTAFARAGEGIRYGCSCPHFTDNKKLCEHLFALALEQSRSALVNNAGTCRWWSPDAGILTGVGDDDEPEDFEDVEDLGDFDDDASMGVVGIGLGRRNGSWRDLAARVTAEQGGREKPKQELLYFLEPSLERYGTRWNPAAEAQAIDRAHRIGQTRNVIAYRLLAKGTVEERVANLQAQKRDLVAGIMGDDQALAGRLTRGDLEALLNLTAITPIAGAPTSERRAVLERSHPGAG